MGIYSQQSGCPARRARREHAEYMFFIYEQYEQAQQQRGKPECEEYIRRLYFQLPTL